MSIDNLPVLDEVKGSANIVDLVARNINPIYSVLKIYGSADIPYYSANEVGQLLEIKNIDQTIKQFTSRECIVTRVKGFDKPLKLLTEHGLYRILFINKTPVGEVFREFVYMVLDKLKQQRVVHLNDVQTDMQQKFSVELQNATNYLQLKVQNLELEIMSNAKTLRKTFELAHRKEQESADLAQHMQHLSAKLITLEERLLRYELRETVDPTSDEALLEYLKAKYMKIKIFIYLMPSRDDSDYNYDYKIYNIYNTPDDYDVMYYRLSRSDTCVRGRIVKELFLEAENQFVELKNLLNNDCMPQGQDTYLCDLNNINEYYVNVRSVPIVEKRKIKMNEIENSLSILWN